MKHTLPELPFPKNALEPHISAETLEYHHGKHHRAYLDKLNQLIQGTEFENLPLEEIVLKAPAGAIFNNAAQAWNHSFYWNSLVPSSKSRSPGGELMKAIEREFGSFESFQEKFSAAAAGQFGSGWAWLVSNGSGKLSILATSNAENPQRNSKENGLIALLTCDVWEHAYYIDYRNERAKYLKAIWSVMNWEFAERNFVSQRKATAA